MALPTFNHSASTTFVEDDTKRTVTVHLTEVHFNVVMRRTPTADEPQGEDPWCMYGPAESLQDAERKAGVAYDMLRTLAAG